MSDNKENRLKIIRKALNIKTQEEFSSLLSIKKYTIGDIESGRQNINQELAIKLEEVFGVNFKYSLTGEGEMFNINPEKQIKLIKKVYNLKPVSIKLSKLIFKLITPENLKLIELTSINNDNNNPINGIVEYMNWFQRIEPLVESCFVPILINIHDEYGEQVTKEEIMSSLSLSQMLLIIGTQLKYNIESTQKAFKNI